MWYSAHSIAQGLNQTEGIFPVQLAILVIMEFKHRFRRANLNELPL